jgi:selenoprotein W-related protein
VQELLKDFEPETGNINLVPSDGGRFEVEVNGNLLYSKLQTGRHVETGEVVGLVRKFISQ